MNCLTKTDRKLNVRTKPVLVHNKTSKLTVLFVLLGAVVIVVPMLIEQVYAKTFAIAQVKGPGKFGDFIGQMSEGKFIQGPTLSDDKKQIIWQTQGDPEGGNEVGRVKVAFDDGFVTFIWSNPTFGKNTCSVLYFAGTFAECKINENGEGATVSYFVSRTSIPGSHPGSCQTGTEKNDNLVGTSGDDCLVGGKGNDRIAGLAGNDKLNGGDGKDLLVGGDGNDELTGGKGSDSFNCGAGNDKITDFNPSEGDKKTADCEQSGHGLGDASGGFQ